MPTARHFPGVAVVNGKIYVIGGGESGGAFGYNVVEVYDPLSNSWTTKAPMPTARYGLQALAVYGLIYAIGGYGFGPNSQDNNYAAVSTVEVYDPANDTWGSDYPMPTPRRTFSASVFDNKIYVFGGIGHALNLAEVEVFDPVTNSWSYKAAMPTARAGSCATTFGNAIYVLGGESISGNGPSEDLNIVERYDPSTNSWTQATPMTSRRGYPTCNTLANKIYAIGGYAYTYPTGAVTFNTMESFAPLIGYVMMKL